jgi:hypothetical protein
MTPRGMKPNTGSGGYVCGRTAGTEAVALDQCARAVGFAAARVTTG